MAAIVPAPLVVARQSDGSLVHVYQGSPLPDSIPVEEAERLIEGGFAAAVEVEPTEVEPVKTGRGTK